MADQQHRYRAENPASIAVHPFDELTLLYHRRSGITHMVIAPAPQILAVMGSEELAVADILHRLSQDFDLGTEGQESLLAVISARLEELALLGLVERL
ncbi:MAG TPA: HPr-rel-A system PqqD family peptide chaperone [Rhizorhapis sp.]